jgi:hypothetical protein
VRATWLLGHFDTFFSVQWGRGMKNEEQKEEI